MEHRLLDIFGVNIEAVFKDFPVFYTSDFKGPKMFKFTTEMLKSSGLDPDLPVLLPGGGLISTVSDWMKFTQALVRSGIGANGVRILQPATVDLMASDHLPSGCKRGPQMVFINGTEKEDSEYTQGLGMAVAVNSPTVSSGTFGWGGIASTFSWVDRKQQLGVVCFTQFIPNFVYALRTQLKKIVYRRLSSTPPRSKL